MLKHKYFVSGQKIFKAQSKMNSLLAMKRKSDFNVLEILTNMISKFAKENLMNNEGRGEKYSVFNLSHNSSVDLRLGIHFESNVITASTSITTMYFALRVVSAEFHTNRSEARQ